MSDDLAPEWSHNYVLTWSGRWHIIDVHAGTDNGDRRTLCGAYGYTRQTLPKHNPTLQAIAKGEKIAPHCKKCEQRVIGPKISPVPTLGEIATLLEKLKMRGVTLESLLYVAKEKVWFDE